jgi:hypothetical protein
MPQAPTILVFDSGLGGLTVYREVKAARPDARYIYLADDAGFPYGDLLEEKLVARVTDVLGKAIAEHRPDMVVVACNTASTLALAQLRARFAVPFVGTVPAIKPACAQSKSKRIAVLGTQATVGREYTKTLIRLCGGGAGGQTRRQRGNQSRDRGLLRRQRRAAHRHDCARLHALSVAARALSRQCALAGRLARPGACDRSPCRQPVA